MADKFGLRLGIEGEKAFKDALRDINQSFKVLGSEMQLVTAQFDKNDKSIQAVTARNAALNREVEQQKEKVATLKAALENAASSFGENDRRTQNWQIALNKAQAELIGMEREMKANNDLLGKLSKEEEAAGKASGDMGDGTKRAHASFAELGGLLKGNVTQSVASVKDGIVDTAHHVVDGAKNMGSSIVEFAKDTLSGENNVKALGDALREKLEARLHGTAEEAEDASDSMEDLGESVDDAAKESEKAGSRFENLGDTLKTAGKVIAGVVSSVGAACGAVGTAMFKMADSAAETGREVNNMSQKLGLSREGYQEWEYVLKKSGTSIDIMGTSMKKLQTTMGGLTEDGDSASKAFAAVGLSFDDVKGKSPEEAFNMTIRALQDMPAGADRTAAALKLFGKGAMELQPLLNKTSAETEELRQRAHEMGLVLSDEQIDASRAFGGAMGKVKDTMAGIKLQLSSALVPAFADGISALWDFAQGAEGGEEKMKSAVDGMTKAVSETLPQFIEKGSGMITSLVKGISMALPGVAKSIADVLPLLVATISGIVPQLIDTVMGIVPTVVAALLSALPTVVDAAIQIVTALLDGLVSMLPELTAVALDAVVAIVQGLLGNLPKILDAALQLILGLADGLLKALPKLIEALPAIILAIVDFVIAAIPQIIEAGITLLTSLVEALPDIITAIVTALPQIIDGIITALLENIPLIIQAGIDLLNALIGALPDIIVTIVEALPEIIKGILGGLLGALPQLIEAGWQLLMGLLEGIFKAVPELLKGIGNVCKSLWNSVLEFFGIRSPSTLFADIGGNLIRGLWNGISDMTQWIKDKILSFAHGFTDSIKSFFGIASPSRLFRDQIGANLAFGLGEGFEAAMKDVTRDMENAVPTDFDIDTNVKGAMHGVSGQGGGGFSLVLHIGTFVNNTAQDLRQLADELSTIMAGEIRRKGLVT
ncbi:MAG: hypothetical protein FWF60_02745 [Oscillospiraceae bacterium]|nr:hypothetical protein [Oscillospiraceae bacterium]